MIIPMTTQPGKRTALTPQERLTVAYAHIVLGIDQQHIAMIMAINIGRVSEAIQAVRIAIEDPKGTIERYHSAETGESS